MMITNLPAEKPKTVQLVEFIESRKQDFKDVLTVNPERFMRTLKNAILKDPKIAEASKQSVFLEVQKACADGLMLDGREAALTRFNSRDGVQVAYIPMVAGIMKRVRNSGEVKSWSCELVYEQEYEQGKFSYTAAPEPMLRHEPIIVGPRGKVVAAYSAVKLRDGSYHYEVMTVEQMERIRKRSKAQNGPWSTDTEEMYRKTVIRRHSKRLPVSSDIIGITQRVDSLYDMDAEHRIDDAPPPRRAADILAEAENEPHEAYDTETGEIIDAEVIEPDAEDGSYDAESDF